MATSARIACAAIGFRVLSATLLVTALLAEATAAQDSSALDAEIAAIDTQIEAVDATIASYEGGLIRALAETRREALLLLRVMVKSRQHAGAGGAKVEVVLPAVVPDPERAEELLAEMAAQQQRIDAAEQEAGSAGGLIQALALSRVETEKLTLAQLQMAYVQARYGIAFPIVHDAAARPVAAKAGDVPEGPKAEADAAPSRDAATPPWADPDHPGIDYGLALFEQAHERGHKISGWWSISEELSAIDDSPWVLATNYSAYEPSIFGDITALVAQCREGETSIVFLPGDFLLGHFDRDSFDVAYRIDKAPAQSDRWSELISNKGAGLFGPRAETFLRKIYGAETFFIRLTGTSRRHDAKFDLAGVQNAIDSVASACGWSTLALSLDDYRTIQTLLNANGFDAGPAGGIWGAASRNALRSFQEQNGLRATGVPDRATLDLLGGEASD